MFTIEICSFDDGELEVTLTFKNENTQITFTPESCDEKFTDKGVCGFGYMSTDELCSLSWTHDEICFLLQRSKNGSMSTLRVHQNSTPEIMQSLRLCLSKWQNAVNNSKKIKEARLVQTIKDLEIKDTTIVQEIKDVEIEIKDN